MAAAKDIKLWWGMPVDSVRNADSLHTNKSKSNIYTARSCGAARPSLASGTPTACIQT